MNRICRRIQGTLAEHGPAALRSDAAAQRHLEECNDCFAVLEALSELDEVFHEMPRVDAPDELVERLLAHSELTEEYRDPSSAGIPAASPSRWVRILRGFRRPSHPRWMLGGAVAAVLMLIAVTTLQVSRETPLGGQFAAFKPESGSITPRFKVAPEPDQHAALDPPPARQVMPPGESRQAIPIPEEFADPEPIHRIPDPKADSILYSEELDVVAEAPKPAQKVSAASHYSPESEPRVQAMPPETVGGYLEGLAQEKPPIWVGAESDISFRGGSPRVETEGPFDKDEAAREEVRERLRDRLRKLPRGLEEPEAKGKRSNENFEPSLVDDEIAVTDEIVFGIPDAPPVAHTGPVHVGGDVNKPVKIFAPEAQVSDVARKARIQGVVILQTIIDKHGNVTDVKVLKGLPMGLDEAAVEAVKQWKFRPATLNGEPIEVYYNLVVKFQLDGGQAAETPPPPATPTPTATPAEATPASPSVSGELARRFLDERSQTEVPFQPPEGYWRNTYVPGDPDLRYLQARLLKHDRASLEALAGGTLLLHDAAQRPTQPFDPPTESALAVFLRADRRAIDGETRLLVQVGLQGTERYGGRRPAMNVSLVLDLEGEISVESATALRALVTAFGQARNPGDRFRLIVAGRPTGTDGDVAVAPEDFRHGPLTVTMQRLLDPDQRPEQDEKLLDLAAALEAAITAAHESDDPDNPLGSSLVVVATARNLDAEVQPLVELAHRSAVGGVPVSVVGVGAGIRLNELDAIALAGQGNRRLLSAAAESNAVVDRELSAVARVIARAVRLRIRLAPGVRLVDVIGSERLDARSAQQTREAERSLDRRIARNLGIEADRGDDEAGIQIVLPSFYAADSHVVLLDVVAPGPGAVADVRVRYKDLVHLRNGVVSDRLSLDRGAAAPGPLERNVLKNLLASRAHDVLEQAGSSLAAGDTAEALKQLQELHDLLLGLGSELPDLEQDRDLQRDVAMLAEYVRLLDPETESRSEQLAHLADSLRYAGRLKVLPRPSPIGGK